MMPNALKLEESVEATAREVTEACRANKVVVPISSGTLAAGVVLGFDRLGLAPKFILHMGYSRSQEATRDYIRKASGVDVPDSRLIIIDEGYQYKDQAKPGPTPPWPCNPYYDLKAFRWWMRAGKSLFKSALFWNIG